MDTCESLDPLDNGGYTDSNCITQSVAYGNTCTAYCELGYNLRGDMDIQCLAGEQWQHVNIPNCESKMIILKYVSAYSQTCNGSKGNVLR